MSITTKTGDKGKTNLANGERLSKSSLLFNAIGDLDELNSWLGVLISTLDESKNYSAHTAFLRDIQQMIYVISAELVKAKTKGKKVTLDDKKLVLIEKWCSDLESLLGKDFHQNFLHPGGCKIAAWIDVTRSVCRRAERSMVKLSEKETIRPIIMSTCNRLSDYLYLLRCLINQQELVEEKQLSLE